MKVTCAFARSESGLRLLHRSSDRGSSRQWSIYTALPRATIYSSATELRKEAGGVWNSVSPEKKMILLIEPPLSGPLGRHFSAPRVWRGIREADVESTGKELHKSRPSGPSKAVGRLAVICASEVGRARERN